jgi:hypothetical protein
VNTHLLVAAVGTKPNTDARSVLAFTRADLLAVLAIVAVLYVLAGLVDFGAPVVDRRKANRATCQNNLKQVGLAFRTWATDFDDHFPMSVSITNGGTMEFSAGSGLFRHFQVMQDEINNPKIITCPADTNRAPAMNFTRLSNSNLSYLVGLDADESRPASILSGDLNLVTNGVPVFPGLVGVSSPGYPHLVRPNPPQRWQCPFLRRRCQTG